ncbi:MAG: LamG domain-containing protein, partial [Planctomycetes bacterium]|nr:LamG domain-containing protein [Planctomycetota bacterium]
MSKKMIYLLSFVFVLSVALTGTARAELVAWWRFDEGSGTAALDSSGFGNDGVIEGDAQWVAGQHGGALEFNGQNARVVAPFIPLDSRSFTITMWVNPDLYTDQQVVISQVETNTTNLSLHYRIYGPESGRVRMGFYSNDLDTTTTLDQGNWYHITFWYDFENENRRIYIDGALEAEASAGPYLGSTGDTIIGAWGTGQWFRGIIDDVQVYDHALEEGEILAAMEGGGGGYPFALGPTPEDGLIHEDTWINLGWRAGDFAASHDVYFGDNFEDVDAGAESVFRGNQTAMFYVVGFPGFAYPDGLVPGTTYYWRIDEVNDTEPNSPWKGKIWSFSVPPKTAYFPDPADGAEGVNPEGTLSWTPGFGGKLHTVYFGETFADVDSAAGGLPQGTASYTPGSLKMAKTYYWRVDEFDIVETHKGNVWSFTTEGAVGSLVPANSAVDVSQTPTLTWAPGFGASHEVYFGADAASLELKGSGNLGSESYEPGQLEWNTTYYWRVDEANNANADSPWTGPLWSFTTANFLIIDDMESYNDLDEGEPGSNRIYLAWADGFDNPAVNGSIVGHANAPFAEQNIVHGGLQSMPMSYDNSVGKSEATLTLTSNKDWTVNGVTTLTIWYRGASANTAETLYVALNG